MSAPIVRAIGDLKLGAAVDQDKMSVPLPTRKEGDILFVYFLGINLFGGNAGKPDTPPGAQVLYTFDDTTSAEILWAIRVTNPNAELTLQRGVGQNVQWAVQSYVVTNVTPSTTWFDAEANDSSFFGYNFPAVTVSGTERLVLGLIAGTAFYTPNGSFVEPSGFFRERETSGGLNNIFYQNNFIDQVASASTAVVPYTHSNSTDHIFTVSIIGPSGAALPTLPQPGQVRLDCAKSYTAWITDADYRTRLDVVGWKSLRWGRILDEISSASVVIPDITGGVRCCIRHGGIEPWRFGLLLERNDIEVWKGPITQIGRDPEAGTTTLAAKDVLARYTKRFAVRDADVEWVNTDSGVAFAGVINTHARSSADVWFVESPTVFTGAGVTRTITPDQLTMAWSVLSDLLGSAVDAYVANGIIYVWEPGEGWRYFDVFDRTLDGPYNVNHDFVYALFTADSFTSLPSWDVDGDQMAGYVAIPSADTGENGFRQIWTAESAESQLAYGVLDFMEPNTLNLPEDTPPTEVASVLQARANTVRDLRALPPVVISGGTLAEGAPVDVPGLRPGSLWIMDIFDACYGQLRTVNRLKSVDVSVTAGNDGPVETISPTMFPPGFEGGEV